MAYDNADLGSKSPAQCENFEDVRHRQALLDITGSDDPYGLDQDGDTIACNGGERVGSGRGDGGEVNDPEVLDGVRPDTRGTTVVVSAGALGTGETLEVRLDARFAATEAEFAAFEVRGANGFGRFPKSGDEVA
jgi:hypothetical protein